MPRCHKCGGLLVHVTATSELQRWRKKQFLLVPCLPSTAGGKAIKTGIKLTLSGNKPTHVFAIHLVFQQKPSK
jgi:hypothetical protein